MQGVVCVRPMTQACSKLSKGASLNSQYPLQAAQDCQQACAGCAFPAVTMIAVLAARAATRPWLGMQASPQQQNHRGCRNIVIMGLAWMRNAGKHPQAPSGLCNCHQGPQTCRQVASQTVTGQGPQLTGSSSEGLLRSMLGNSSGAIQGSVPLMFPLTKVEAFFLDRPRSPILTTGRFRSRRSHRRLSHFCRRKQWKTH